jgi:hypothetical protein
MRLKKEVIIFDGTNYSEWESEVRFHLMSKNLWQVVVKNPLEVGKAESENSATYVVI